MTAISIGNALKHSVKRISLVIAISGAITQAARAQTPDDLRQRAVEVSRVQSDLIGAAALLEQRLAEINLLTSALERSSADAAGLRAQLDELRAQLPVPPTPIPTAARVNLYAAPSWAGIMGQAALWVDITAYTQSELDRFLGAAVRPAGGVGSYLSSCDVVEQIYQDRVPLKTIPAEAIPLPMRFPSNFNQMGRWTVNLRDPAARALLGDQIVAEARRRLDGYGFVVCYLDNVAHPDSGDRRFTWQERCDGLAYIHARLPVGVRLFANVTLPPGYWSTADLLRLASVCDGVTFEIALHPNLRGDPIKVRAAIADVRELVRAGLTVIFVPARNSTWSSDRYVAEKQFAAGFALACREKADSPVHATPGSQPPENPPWMAWAATLGQPTGDVEPGPASGMLVRRYAGGTLVLRPVDGVAEIWAR